MIRAVESDDLNDDIIALYESSFSRTEKIPIGNLNRTFGRGGILRAYYDGDLFVGFTFGFIDDGIMFLVYFATVPELRGKGYGSEILKMLREEFRDLRIFLVVEPCDPNAPDIAVRKRRQEFYRRNGCKDTGVKVLSDDEWFDTMSVRGDLSEKEMVGTIGLYEDIHNGRQ